MIFSHIARLFIQVMESVRDRHGKQPFAYIKLIFALGERKFPYFKLCPVVVPDHDLAEIYGHGALKFISGKPGLSEAAGLVEVKVYFFQLFQALHRIIRSKKVVLSAVSFSPYLKAAFKPSLVIFPCPFPYPV